MPYRTKIKDKLLSELRSEDGGEHRMTDEEAIAYFKRHIELYCVTGICREAEEMAIKSLEQEPILDKVRAEIDEQYDRVHPYNISCAEGLEMALEIIDKYKAESEVGE